MSTGTPLFLAGGLLMDPDYDALPGRDELLALDHGVVPPLQKLPHVSADLLEAKVRPGVRELRPQHEHHPGVEELCARRESPRVPSARRPGARSPRSSLASTAEYLAPWSAGWVTRAFRWERRLGCKRRSRRGRHPERGPPPQFPPSSSSSTARAAILATSLADRVTVPHRCGPGRSRWEGPEIDVSEPGGRAVESRSWERGCPGRIRTWGLLLRRESLYPAELSGLARRLRLSRAVSCGSVSITFGPSPRGLGEATESEAACRGYYG